MSICMHAIQCSCRAHCTDSRVAATHTPMPLGSTAASASPLCCTARSVAVPSQRRLAARAAPGARMCHACPTRAPKTWNPALRASPQAGGAAAVLLPVGQLVCMGPLSAAHQPGAQIRQPCRDSGPIMFRCICDSSTLFLSTWKSFLLTWVAGPLAAHGRKRAAVQARLVESRPGAALGVGAIAELRPEAVDGPGSTAGHVYVCVGV